MRLRFWRMQKNWSLAEAAIKLGLGAASSLCDIERGTVFPSPESVTIIEAATGGAVTYADHRRAWAAADPHRFSKLQAAGRSAARIRLTPAKPKKECRDGGKGKRRGS